MCSYSNNHINFQKLDMSNEVEQNQSDEEKQPEKKTASHDR